MSIPLPGPNSNKFTFFVFGNSFKNWLERATLNKELVGKPTEFFLSVRYPNEDFYRHISQIYEAIFEGLIPAILLLLFYYKFKVKNGIITSFFLINYGLSRIIIENFRVPDIQVGLKFNLLSQGQLLSIPIVILGFYFLYLCQYKQR